MIKEKITPAAIIYMACVLTLFVFPLVGLVCDSNRIEMGLLGVFNLCVFFKGRARLIDGKIKIHMRVFGREKDSATFWASLLFLLFVAEVVNGVFLLRALKL